eukprot:1860949-Rhodomonas_salina.1
MAAIAGVALSRSAGCGITLSRAPSSSTKSSDVHRELHRATYQNLLCCHATATRMPSLLPGFFPRFSDENDRGKRDKDNCFRKVQL